MPCVWADGPTHQPVEQTATLSAIPQLTVIRPADANETAAAWQTAMTQKHPVALVFTRQDLPVLVGDHVREGVAKGGYILAETSSTPDIILISRGSEVHLAHEAYKALANEGVKVRLVSMPSWNLFDKQDAAYRESVLPKSVRRRVSIEAGVTMGWEKYVGLDGIVIGLDRFGGSAPYEVLYSKFGLTAEAVLTAAHSLLAK